MNKNNTKGFREGAMMVALSAVLLLVVRYMPLITVFVNIICAIPMAVLAMRNSFKVLIPAAIATFVITIIIDGNVISALSMLFMTYLPGVVAGYMMGKREPFFRVLIGTSLSVCVGWIFEIVVLELFMENGISDMLSETLKQTETVLLSAVEKMNPQQLESLGMTPQVFVKTALEASGKIFRTMFPSMVIIFSMITGYFIIRASGFIAKRARLAEVETIPFSHLRAPRSMSTVAVLMYFIYLFMSAESRFQPVFGNIVFVLYTIIGICGLSFIDFKLKNKIKSFVVRFLIYGLVLVFGGLFMSFITNALIIIGILDAGRDFRRLGSY